MSSEEQQPDTGQTNPTVSRPSLEDDEEILLAHFDRYIDSEIPLNPARSEDGSQTAAQSQPPSPTGDASTPQNTPALDILTARYPKYDLDSLRAILSSVENDFHAAEALLEGSVPPPSSSDDAEIALRLQLREQVREQRRHRRNDAAIPLEKPVMDKVLGTLREIVVPSLRAHFAELVLPDYRDDSASLVYSLSQLQVTALTLPADNVAVTPATNRQAVHVNVLNAHLELEVGRWSYENRGLVPVKDAGRASVSVHGLNIALRLEPRWSHAGGTRLVILECNVTVDGVVRFKTHGAAADWAYNAIAVVLKPLVVSYLKEAVADAVTQALAVHLRQWAFAGSLDDVESPSTHTRNASSAPVTAAE